MLLWENYDHLTSTLLAPYSRLVLNPHTPFETFTESSAMYSENSKNQHSYKISSSGSSNIITSSGRAISRDNCYRDSHRYKRSDLIYDSEIQAICGETEGVSIVFNDFSTSIPLHSTKVILYVWHISYPLAKT